MGMFDEVRCHYPLPKGQSRLFQTKDTPEQLLDQYEIREDGSLWHQNYDIEDQSDPNAEGIMKFVGCMTRVNTRWVPSKFNGKMRFYAFYDEKRHRGWIEYIATFRDGQLKNLDGPIK